MPQPGQQQRPMMMPRPQMPPQTNMMPPMQPGMMPPMQPGMMPPQMNPDVLYNQKGQQMINAVMPDNPNYKRQVGDFIYEHVEAICGGEKAPKVTGMLIDLPIEEIRDYILNFGKLKEKVAEASILLDNGN